MAEIATGTTCRKIVIQYPNGHRVPTFFAAYGCASIRVSEVIGLVTGFSEAPQRGKTKEKEQLAERTAELLQKALTHPDKIKEGGGLYFPLIAVGKTLVQPPHWVIALGDLPENADLCLWIVGKPSCKDDKLILQPMPFQTIERGYDVKISSPGSDATVPTTFSASGTGGNAGDTVVGGLEGPNFYMGTVLQGAPNWVVQFANVQPGFPYTLDVVAGGVGATNPSTNITVKA